MCLILDPVDDVGLRTEARSRVDEALESAASCLPPRLSRAMLSDVHAHVEATVVLPEVFKSNTCALTLLQQPLGMSEGESGFDKVFYASSTLFFVLPSVSNA